MIWVFLICAVIGGTLLLAQLAMQLIGLSHDLDGDFGGDVDAGDVHFDFHGDAGDVDPLGHPDAGFHGTAHLDGSNIADAHAVDHPATGSVFRVVSVRTVVAAMTFFGLGGLTANSTGQPPMISLLIAIGSGIAAMLIVYKLMQFLYSLQAEGTVRIQRALGKRATVYLKIPGHRSGKGKVHLVLQKRTAEYAAVTDADTIPAGSEVVVRQVLDPETVLVEPDTPSRESPPEGTPE